MPALGRQPCIGPRRTTLGQPAVSIGVENKVQSFRMCAPVETQMFFADEPAEPVWRGGDRSGLHGQLVLPAAVHHRRRRRRLRDPTRPSHPDQPQSPAADGPSTRSCPSPAPPAGAVASSRGARPVSQISPVDPRRCHRTDARQRAAARRIGRSANRQRLLVLRPDRLRENVDRTNHGSFAQLRSGSDSGAVRRVPVVSRD